jgi:LEA14-like dessication related protein
MNRSVLALALAGGVLLGGCATLPKEGGVAVSLVSLRPVQTSLFETSAELTLRFTNEAPRPVTLAGSTHRLYVNGTYVGRAITHEPLTVPHLGTMTQTVTAHLENLALMKKAQEMTTVTTVGYRIDSRLHTAEAQGGGTMAATSTGELDLSGLLPVQAAPRAQ